MNTTKASKLTVATKAVAQKIAKHGIRVVVFMLVLGLATSSGFAAPITWGTATTISADANVSTTGTFKYAYHWNSTNQTVNGVTFVGTTSITTGGSDVGLAGFDSHHPAFTSTSTPFNDLSTAYKATLAGSPYNSGATATVTLKNLTIGKQYAVQVWIEDARAEPNNRSATLTSSGGNSVALDFNLTNADGGVGQYSIGTFVADAVTQTFTIVPAGTSKSAQLNALQVRDITPLNVTVTAPVNGQAFAVGSSVTATVAVAYGATNYQTVAFYTNGVSAWSTNNTSATLFTIPLGVLGVGTYTNYAYVLDANSGTAYSSTNTFSVVPTYYWDTDGSTAGFGDTAGTWGSDAFWSTDSTGASATANPAITSVDRINFGTASLALGSTASAVGVSGTVNVNSITFGAAQSNPVTLSGGTSITLGGTTPTITVNNAADTISSVLAGSAGLTKAGNGTLTLSGNNSYSGTTVISGGILAISGNNALGATSGNTTIAATGLSTGPQLSLSGGITSPEPITLTGVTEQNQYAGVINNTSGTNTLSGAITLASPSGSIRLSSSGGELIFSGTISQTGTKMELILSTSGGGFTVNNAIANNGAALGIVSQGGSGSVTLKAAPGTGIGAVSIRERGLLKLGVNNAIRTDQDLKIGEAWNYTPSDQGTFDLAGFNQTVKALVGNKNTSNVGADSTRIVTNSAASGTSTLTVGNGNNSGTFNGVIRDGATANVALTKIGTGTQTLVGDSNYSGVTTISAGAITITHANALGSTAGNTTIAATGSNSGGVLQLSGGITTAENFTITGTTEAGSWFGAIRSISGNNIVSGNITLASPSNGIRLEANAGNLTFSGNISQTGTTRNLVLEAEANRTLTVDKAIANNGGSLLIDQAGTVILKGVSGSGIGDVYMFGGTLKLGVTDALNTTRSLELYTDGSPAPTFDLAGFNQTINALKSNGTGATANRKVINSVAGTKTLTVGNGGGTGTFNGQINTGTGNIQLIKTGAGIQTLSGACTYTGATTIDAGTLKLGANDVLQNTTAVSIGAATLDADIRTDTVGTLDVTAAATINLGSAAAALVFADSSAIDWTGGTLNITVGALGPTSIKFGTSRGGLTSGQLALISVNGSGAGNYMLDANGYLVRNPGTLISFF